MTFASDMSTRQDEEKDHDKQATDNDDRSGAGPVAGRIGQGSRRKPAEYAPTANTPASSANHRRSGRRRCYGDPGLPGISGVAEKMRAAQRRGKGKMRRFGTQAARSDVTFEINRLKTAPWVPSFLHSPFGRRPNVRQTKRA